MIRTKQNTRGAAGGSPSLSINMRINAGRLIAGISGQNGKIRIE